MALQKHLVTDGIATWRRGAHRDYRDGLKMLLFSPPDVEKLRAKGNVSGLIKAISYKNNARLSRAAVSALGEIGDARATEPLIAAMGDKYWGMRLAAAASLGKIGDTRAVRPLIAALKDEHWRVRLAAAVALDNLRWQPDSDETEAQYQAAKRNWDRCVEIGAPSVEVLIAALEDKHSDKYAFVREGAAEALGKIGDIRAMEPLISALKDEYEYIRLAAASALGHIGDAQAVEPVISGLKDEHRLVREAVVGALSNIGTLAVEPLIAALNDEHWLVRRGAAEALGNIGTSQVVEPLLSALEDERSLVREAAAEALGKIGDTRAMGPLMSTSEDKYILVQLAAVEALRALYHKAELGGALMQAYCVKCRSTVEIKNPQKVTLRNKRPATSGTCPKCGTKVFRIGKA